MAKVVIHTDGSSKGNPGPGGWAAILELGIMNNELWVKEIGGNEEMTTNNRMELRAAIEALRNTEEGSEVEIFSDSEYLIKGITMWIWGWMKKGWKTASKDPVLNQELWQDLYTETKTRKVEWRKVAGHSGHELNDRCDEIAQTFADQINIKLFDGSKEEYEKFLKSKQ